MGSFAAFLGSLMAWGVLIEFGFLSMVCLGDLRHHLSVFFAIYALQFLLMHHVWSKSQTISRSTIWAFALLFRLTLFSSIPSLSDDIYRYNWEGRVQRVGRSPYEFPPSAPELAFLRDE